MPTFLYRLTIACWLGARPVSAVAKLAVIAGGIVLLREGYPS